MTAWLPLLLACSSAPAPAPPAPATAPGQAAGAPPAEAPAAPAQPELAVELVEGWGALLEKDGTWYRTGGGDLAAGPKQVHTLAPTGETGPCGQVVADPQGAMIALPQGTPAPGITPAPAILASLVERAAWRLDEALPDPDAFSPAATSTAPAESRGVALGSVAKVRRKLAPPVLVASGHRECTGVVAILSADGSETLLSHRVDQACEPLRILPPNDLDGDGHRELAAWSRSRAQLYRFVEGPGDPSLVLLADWTCK